MRSHLRCRSRGGINLYLSSIFTFIAILTLGSCENNDKLNVTYFPIRQSPPLPIVTFSPQMFISPFSEPNQIQPLRLCVRISTDDIREMCINNSHAFYEAAVVPRRFEAFSIIVYSPQERVYIAINSPRNAHIQDILIYGTLDQNYASTNAESASAIFRVIPTTIEGSVEPETVGIPCNLNVNGELRIISLAPLQGSFVFTCQFADGTSSGISGVFSQ